MNRVKQCAEIDAALLTLVRRVAGTPEAFERGRTLISALGRSWVEIARDAGEGGATVEAMARWDAQYADAYRAITLNAIAENKSEARLAQ